MNYSQLLLDKADIIVDNWVKTVYLDTKIKSSNSLSYTKVKNHIPHLLIAMANIIYSSEIGLGLSIVKQLVELMQAKILLESQVGVGSTFTVILPLEVKSCLS